MTRFGQYRVKPHKVGADGTVYTWGVYDSSGKLAAQVTRSRREAVGIAKRRAEIDAHREA